MIQSYLKIISFMLRHHSYDQGCSSSSSSFVGIRRICNLMYNQLSFHTCAPEGDVTQETVGMPPVRLFATSVMVLHAIACQSGPGAVTEESSARGRKKEKAGRWTVLEREREGGGGERGERWREWVRGREGKSERTFENIHS